MNLCNQLSPFTSVRQRHQSAPLLLEREQYLSSMLKRGVSRVTVRTIARYLIHVVHLLKMTSLRKVGLEEIEAASRIWAAQQSPLIHNRNQPGSSFMFVRVAQSWLRFHGQLPTLPPCPFEREIEEFAESMRIRGLSGVTVKARSYRLLTFLRWFGDQQKSLRSVSLSDIDEYLAFKKLQGWSVTTIATAAQTLRSFFRYAEPRGWCAPGIALGISHPQRRRSDNRPKGPTWAEVRKLIKSASGTSQGTCARRPSFFCLPFTVCGAVR